MNNKPTRNDDELNAAFRHFEGIFKTGEGTAVADEMKVMVTLIETYEYWHHPIGLPDPVEAIKCRMEKQGLTARDLEVCSGPSANSTH